MATKIIFKLEIILLYLKKNIFFILGGLTFGVLFFEFWPWILSTYSRLFTNTQIIGVQGLYSDKNLPDFITNDISYGLTKANDNGKFEISPIVAQLIRENDNLDYIFTLNDNIYWQNGKNFTSSDVNYNIQGLTITSLGPYKVKVSTKETFAPMLSLLKKPILTKNFIGLGNYKVKKITYKDGYVKSVNLTSQDNQLKDKIYRFYPSEKDLINAYKIGEVDTAYNLTSGYDFSNWPKTKITPLILSDQKYIAVFFNTSKISSKQTRQALSYATPKSQDKNERCLGPISPNSWAYNPSIKEYNFNPTRAKELYTNNKLDKINLTVTDRSLLSIAEEIKNSWQNNLELNTTVSIENQIDKDNYEAAIAYGSIPTDPDQYLYWHSTQTETNITMLNNSRIDKLLEEGRASFDPIERKQIYQDFQKYLLEEAPAIFIAYPSAYTIDRIK